MTCLPGAAAAHTPVAVCSTACLLALQSPCFRPAVVRHAADLIPLVPRLRWTPTLQPQPCSRIADCSAEGAGTPESASQKFALELSELPNWRNRCEKHFLGIILIFLVMFFEWLTIGGGRLWLVAAGVLVRVYVGY